MKILNHRPWFGTFPLEPIHIKIWELSRSEGNSRFISKHKLRISLSTVNVTYTWITNILMRIDDELNNHLEFTKKIRLLPEGVPVSFDELPPASSHLVNLDINSLIIYLHILMDDVSRFMEYLFVENRLLKHDKFLRLKNSINNYEGDRIEELNTIIQKTKWYNELNQLRKQPVVHTGVKIGGIEVRGETVGVYLRHFIGKKNRLKSKFISNLEIDEMCDNVHSFLNELNEFLCTNFDYLPLCALRIREEVA